VPEGKELSLTGEATRTAVGVGQVFVWCNCIKAHAASMEEMRNAHKVLVLKTDGKSHLENLGVDGRRTLKWT
jgi:hypothetical protein